MNNVIFLKNIDSYSIEEISNELILKSNFTINQIQLQKLLFLSNNFTIDLIGRKLIFKNHELGKFGPEYSFIKTYFKGYGNKEIKELIYNKNGITPKVPKNHENVIKLIHAVYEKYKKYSTIEISNIVYQMASENL